MRRCTVQVEVEEGARVPAAGWRVGPEDDLVLTPPYRAETFHPGWLVTHVPTGRRVPGTFRRKKADAELVLRALLDCGVSWGKLRFDDLDKRMVKTALAPAEAYAKAVAHQRQWGLPWILTNRGSEGWSATGFRHGGELEDLLKTMPNALGWSMVRAGGKERMLCLLKK